MAALLNAGELNQRVTLQQKSVVKNSLSEEIVTWVDEATFSCSALPLHGREFTAGAQIQGSADVRFVCRYRTDVQAGKRLVWRGAPYDIRNVADVEGARVALEIMAASEVGDAR